MLKLKKGCSVPYPEKLKEGYEILENQIVANVSVDKIEEIMQHFICTHDEPLFFILEIPSNQKDEHEIMPGVVETLHKDVYYIDGCKMEEALVILMRSGKLLIDDGLCAFGFGGHISNDEIMFGKYNVTTVFSKDISKFDGFFEQHEIHKTDDLTTAWDTFSHEHYGKCELVAIDEQDVYSIPEQYSEWGIYKAEQRED